MSDTGAHGLVGARVEDGLEQGWTYLLELIQQAAWIKLLAV